MRVGKFSHPKSTNSFTINNLTKTGRTEAKQEGRTEAKQGGRTEAKQEERRQNRKKGRTEAKQEDGGRVWNNEKKEDDRIRYPPTKLLIAHI